MNSLPVHSGSIVYDHTVSVDSYLINKIKVIHSKFAVLVLTEQLSPLLVKSIHKGSCICDALCDEHDYGVLKANSCPTGLI